jgi:hypothetical protein
MVYLDYGDRHQGYDDVHLIDNLTDIEDIPKTVDFVIGSFASKTGG